MSGITIQLPRLDAEHSIEIDVRINGEKKTYHYRVELLDWEEDCEQPQEIRIQCLRRAIAEREQEWQLVNIGAPTEKNIPLMFKRKRGENVDVPEASATPVGPSEQDS